jgi:DnaK suppressor protein
VAAKTPAKKAVKAAKKTAKPVVKKVAAAKPASKPVVKAVKKPTAVKQPVAKKAPAKKAAPVKTVAATPTKKPVAKTVAVAKKPAAKKATPVATAKPVAAKPAPKPASKPAPVKSVPAKAPAPAPVSAPKKVEAKPSAKPATPSSKNPVPVSKSSAKTPSKIQSPAKPVVTRPVGKVAVAVTSRPSAPTPRNKYKVVEYKIDEATGRPILPTGYKPASDEEYMSTLQQEYFRQRLSHWRIDLVEESKQTIENLRDEVRDIGDEAERATRETENSLELRTRDRYRKLIGKIDSTLKRLDAGDYGYCVDTGEEIGLERLEARLTAERTIDAQERWEHMQKQQGD